MQDPEPVAHCVARMFTIRQRELLQCAGSAVELYLYVPYVLTDVLVLGDAVSIDTQV